MSELEFKTHQLRDLVYELSRADDEINRLISSVRSLYSEVMILIMLISTNPIVAAIFAAIGAGVEVVRAIRFEAERQARRAEESERRREELNKMLYGKLSVRE